MHRGYLGRAGPGLCGTDCAGHPGGLGCRDHSGNLFHGPDAAPVRREHCRERERAAVARDMAVDGLGRGIHRGHDLGREVSLEADQRFGEIGRAAWNHSHWRYRGSWREKGDGGRWRQRNGISPAPTSQDQNNCRLFEVHGIFEIRISQSRGFSDLSLAVPQTVPQTLDTTVARTNI
jgi:hypothetical protein